MQTPTHYERNRDIYIARSISYYYDNREAVLEKNRIYKAKNPDKAREYTRRWREKKKAEREAQKLLSTA
jgi:hypothetical protein